jgi:flavin-dependent dehydrogenase
MNKDFDCIVVGAGVCGCTFSLILSKAGYNVLLVDKKEQEKIGHDWWDAIEENVFTKIDIPELKPKPKDLFKKSPITFYTPNFDKIGSFMPDDLNLYRRGYSQRLINTIKDKGVEFQDKFTVLEPMISENSVIGIKGKSMEDNQIKSYTANLVIDASGLNAIIRDKSPEKYGWKIENNPGDLMIAYREIRNKIKDTKNEFKTYFGYNGGIFWENHFQEGLVDFFGGLPIKEGIGNPKDIIYNFIKKNEYCGDKILMGGYTAKIPIRHCLDSFVAENVLILGDAAFQTNPMNGCGVASCIIAGSMAAETAIEALETKDFSEESLWSYNTKYIKSRGASFAGLDIIKKFLITLSEDEVNFLFDKKILKISDIESGYDLEPVDIGLFDLFGRILRGISKLNLLLKLNRCIKRSNYIRKVYERYPDKPGEEFQIWREKVSRIFNKSF